MEFGNYNKYETWPYQVLGVSCSLIIFAVVFSGMSYSKMYNVFMKTPLSEEKDLDWVDVNLEMPEKESPEDDDYVNMDAMEEHTDAAPSDHFPHDDDDHDDDAPVLT